jgi:hypothetical protein
MRSCLATLWRASWAGRASSRRICEPRVRSICSEISGSCASSRKVWREEWLLGACE